MNKILFIALLSLIMLPSMAQESIMKEYAMPRSTKGFLNPICLYPSTLRMINLSGDPQFYELVNDIEKILIYTLDSATFVSKDYVNCLKEYEKIGYEEYILIHGKKNLRLIGKKDQYVGIIVLEDRVVAFYLRGKIGFQKIPTLVQNFRKDDILNLNIITDSFK